MLAKPVQSFTLGLMSTLRLQTRAEFFFSWPRPTS